MATPEEIKAIAGLYVAYFDRAPDPAGLQFWVDQLDNGRDFATISQDFADSPEAKEIYPFLDTPDVSGLDPTNLVTSIYNNLFGREPDAAGLSFWVDVVESGAVAVGDMVEAIMMGARDTVVNGELILDKTTVENKIECALEFSVTAANIPGFVFDTQAYNAARGAIEGVDATQESVDAAKFFTTNYFGGTGTQSGSTFTLCEHVIEVSPEIVETQMVTNTVIYWGYNPHGHDETDGVDNTAEPNTNNLTNEGPADGGIPAEDFFLTYWPQIVASNFQELNGIDPDNDVFSIVDFSAVTDLEINTSADGSGEGTITFTYTDGTQDDIALGAEYFGLLRDVVFDEEGNSRFFEKEVAADVPVYVDEEGNVTLDSTGNVTEIGRVDAVLTTTTAAVYATIPPILTPSFNNGGTFEQGFPDQGTDLDDLIVAGRLELLHGAIIDGGLGHNTLEIDAKGVFAQPKALNNIQHIAIENLPNIYTFTNAQPEDGQIDLQDGNVYPNLGAGTAYEQDSIIDVSRARDLETMTITQGDFEDLSVGQDNDPGDLTVTGIRNGAVVTMDGFFGDYDSGGDVRLNYSGVTGDGIKVVFNNLMMLSDLEIAHNSPKLTIESTGGANYVEDGNLSDDGDSNDDNGYLRELIITGDASLFIEGNMDDTFEDDSPITINASANTGGVDLNFSDTEQVTFIGSQADDRLAVNTFDSSTTQQGPDFDNDEEITIFNAEGDNYYDLNTYDLTVTDGDGDNNLEFNAVRSTITMGDGDNHIEGFAVNLTATVGDGDNKFDIQAFDSPTEFWPTEDDFPTLVDITAGEGSNIFNIVIDPGTLQGGQLGHFLTPAEVNITAGDGGNLIQIPALPFDDNGVLSTVTINTGSGADTMVVGGSTITINSGGGGDEITLLGIDDDYVTEVASLSATDYNYKGFVPSIYGAEINIDTGSGSAQINLGAFLDDAFLVTGALVAKEGSSITGSDITLFVNTDADLRAATLDGITAVVMDDDNRQYTGQGFPAGSTSGSGAASLTLLDTQVAQLLAEGVDFSTQGETFGAQSILTIVITGDVVLSDLIDLAAWNDSVKLCFVVEDGASLTMTAEELHNYVAPQGIAVDEQNGYIDNQVTITNAGPNFNAYGDQNGGTGGGTVAGGTPMEDVTVLFTEEGFERPEQDAPVNLIQWDSDVDNVIEVTKYPFATDLEITGAADISVENPIFLGDGFTIDFSDFGGDFVQMVNGVPTLTVANFNNLTPDVNDGPGGNVPNDGDIEITDVPDPSTWGNIQGNGTSADPVRINMLVENGTSTGDCDLGVTEGGFLSSGVQQFVLTGFHDDDMDLLAQSGAWSADIVVCDQTEDLEVLGLQNNRNSDVTFWQVNWGTEILLEGDGYANASDQEKNLGDPDYSEVGKVTANFFEPGANAFVRVTNQGTELGLNEDAEDGFDPTGERKLDVAGIVLNNADRLLLAVEDGDAKINDVTGLDLERIIVTGPEDVEIVVASIEDADETDGGKDGFAAMMEGLDSSDLVSIDGSGVAGTFTLTLTGNADLSGVTLTGIDAICIDPVMGANITMTADQVVALGAVLEAKDGPVVLNVVEMGDQLIDMAALVTDDLSIGTVTFVDEAVTVDPGTNFGGATALIIPEDSQVTMTVAQFETADAGTNASPDVQDGDGMANAMNNKLILTEVPNGEALGATPVVEVDLSNVDSDVDVDIVFDNFDANANFNVSGTGGETTTAVISGTTDLSAGALGTVDCIVLQDGAELTLSQAQIQALAIAQGAADLSEIIKLAPGATATLNINEIDGTGFALDLTELVDDWNNGLDIGTLTIDNTDGPVTLPFWTLGGADEIVTPTAQAGPPEFGVEQTSLTLTQNQFLSLDGIGFISGDAEINIIAVTNNNDGPDAGLEFDNLLIDTSGITAPKGIFKLLEEGPFVTAVGETVTLNEASDISGFEIILTDGQLIRFATEAQASGAIVTEVIVGNPLNPTGVAWLFDTVSGPVDTSNYDPALNTLFVSEDLVNGANEEELWTFLPGSINVQKYTDNAPNGLIVQVRVNNFSPFSGAPDGITFDDQSEFQTTGALILDLEGNVTIGDVTIDDTVGEGAFQSLQIDSTLDAEDLPPGYTIAGGGVLDPSGGGILLQPNKIGDIFLNAPVAANTVVFIDINTSDDQLDFAVPDGTNGSGSGLADLDEGQPIMIGTINLGMPAAGEHEVNMNLQGDHDIMIAGIDMSDPALTLVNISTGGFNFGADAELNIGGTDYGKLAEDMGLTADVEADGLDDIFMVENFVAETDDDFSVGETGLEPAPEEVIVTVVGGTNDFKAMDDGMGDTGFSANTGFYATGPAVINLTADQIEAIGIEDADMNGVADNWVLAPGVNPNDVTINICDLDSTNGPINLDLIQAAGFNIGTITLTDIGADTYIDLDNGTTLGGADQIVMELDFFDITLELSADQFNSFSGVIVEDRSDDALTDPTIVGTVIVDELESAEDPVTGEVTIDVSMVATTGDNTFFLQDANNETNANDPTDAGGGAGTDTDYDGVVPLNDTTFSAAANLGDFSVSLYDVDSTGTPDELAGQTVRFSTEVQADGRTVLVLDPDGTNPNKDEMDTNVVWLFDALGAGSPGLDVSGYAATLGRIWVSDELVDSVGGDIDSLFTIDNPDNPGTPLFTLDANIIKRIETEDLDALLQLNVPINQRVEVTAFTQIAGAEFEIDDPLVSIATLRIDMGGATDINNLELDNLLGPVDPFNPNFPGDDDFTLLEINSLLANNPDHYLLPDAWTPDNPLPSNDVYSDSFENNVVGDISSGPDRGVLHTIRINTFENDVTDTVPPLDPIVDDETDADFVGSNPYDSGSTGNDALAETLGREGAQFVAETIYFSDDGDTTAVGGDTGEPQATLILTGENDVTVKSLDTSDAEITSLVVDTTAYTGTFTITGGSPAFNGDDATNDTTTALTITNGNAGTGVVQLASTVTFDDPATMDDLLTPQVENNEANIEYNVGTGNALPYAGVSSGALETIDTSGHDGTISLGVISQVNSETFSINAGAGGQLFGCLGTALDNTDDTPAEETPSLSATGTWTFTGAAGGDPAFGGVNNFDLEIKAVDVADGGTLVFDAVDVCFTGDVDLTGAVLSVINGSTLKVAAGAKLTLSVEQIDDLDFAGITISGEGTVCVVGESDDSDLDLNTTFSNLHTATVDFSAVTLAGTDGNDALDIVVGGAEDNTGATLYDEDGNRVAQTIIGSANNDFVGVPGAADDGDPSTLDVILQLGADNGDIGDPRDTPTGDPDPAEVVGDVITRGTLPNIQIIVDEGFDQVNYLDGEPPAGELDIVEIAAGAEFYSAGVRDQYVASADTVNNGIGVIEADGNGGFDDPIDMSDATGPNGWILLGVEDAAGAGDMDDIAGSDQDDVIIDGAAELTGVPATEGDNDGQEDEFTGNGGMDEFVFNVARSEVAEFTTDPVQIGQDIDELTATTTYADGATVQLFFDIGGTSPAVIEVTDNVGGVDLETSVDTVAAAIAAAINARSDAFASTAPGGIVIAGAAGAGRFNLTGGANSGDFTVDPLLDGGTHGDDPLDADDDRSEAVITIAGTVTAGEVYTVTIMRGDGTSYEGVHTVTAGQSAQDVLDALATELNTNAFGSQTFYTLGDAIPVAPNAPQSGAPAALEMLILDNDMEVSGGFTVSGATGVSTVVSLSSSSVIDGGETALDDVDADVITDFVSADDSIDFTDLPAGTVVGAYAEGADAADFVTALADANTALGGGATYYLTASIADGEGLLFYDANGDGDADGLVRLPGINASNFGADDII